MLIVKWEALHVTCEIMMELASSIWIRHQQCPCGDLKCYIKYEAGEENVTGSETANSGMVGQNGLASSSPTEVVFTPYVGQTFESDNEAFEYYNIFARNNGFSIRKAQSTGSPNLGIYRRDFVCYCSGFNQTRKKADTGHPRDRKSVRCGCDPKLHLTKELVNGVSQWYVSQFSNVHNHELLEDEQVRLLPAYRKIQESDQERILLLSKAGFHANKIVKVLESEKGLQPGQLPFIDKDIRNFVRMCKKTIQENDAMLNQKRENDAAELLEACKSMGERDVDFIFDFTRDGKGKIENIAWSYGHSVRSYALFGDVVIFNTMYSSITWAMLLGLWFGVDNQGKAIIFGCVLLRDEASHSFVWALQTFIRFMRGRHPQTIITDMGSALRDAIANKLASTRHVISVRHIMSKLSSWFSSFLGLQYAEFKSEFEMLSYLEKIEEFEDQWNHSIAKINLGSNKHIALLYSYRASWPFSYIRGYFLARSMTAEYTRSLHAFLINILSVQTCLQKFFKQVGAASIPSNIGDMAKELMKYVPHKTCMPIEEHAQSVLTPYAFNSFQNELVLSLQCAVTQLASGSYLVRHYKKLERECLVIWIPEDEQIHCTCKGFENSGTLCRHSLRVLVTHNYFQVPDKYLPFRWRLDSSMISVDQQNIHRTNEECY